MNAQEIAALTEALNALKKAVEDLTERLDERMEFEVERVVPERHWRPKK